MTDQLILELVGKDSGASAMVDKIKSSVGDMMKFAGGALLAKGIESVTGAIGGLVGGMVSGNAEFERYQTQFGVLLGSADKAKARLAELADFGAKTPFELPEVVRADKVLQGFGLESEAAAKKFGFSGAQIRTIAGDVASGAGANFEDMANLIGKFSSGATGEAISRFQEMGITTREELTKMGLQFSKSGELLSPLPKAVNTVLNVMKQKYGGMMDAQSKTFEGMVSNLEDWKSNTLRVIGTPIFEVLKDKLSGLLDFLGSDAVQSATKGFADALASGIGRGIDFLDKNVFPIVGKGFGLIRDAVITFQQALSGNWADNSIINPFHRVVGVIGLVVNAFQKGGLQQAFQTLLPFAQQAFGSLVSYIQGQLPTWMAALGQWGTQAWTWLQQAIPPLLAQLSVWGGQVLSWVASQLPGWMAALSQWGQAAWGWLEQAIPPLLAQLGQWSGQLLGWVASQLPGWLANLLQWGTAAVVWLGEAIPPLIVKAGEFLAALTTWAITTVLPKLVEWGGKFAVALYEWVATTLIPQIGPKLVEFGGAVVTALGNILGSIGKAAGEIGSSIVSGIASGISNGVESLKTAARKAASDALEAAKNFLQGHSPSERAAREVGITIPQGIAMGMLRGQGLIEDAATQLASIALTVTNSAQLIGDAFRHATGGGNASERLINRLDEANKIASGAASIFKNLEELAQAVQAAGQGDLRLDTGGAVDLAVRLGSWGTIVTTALAQMVKNLDARLNPSIEAASDAFSKSLAGVRDLFELAKLINDTMTNGVPALDDTAAQALVDQFGRWGVLMANALGTATANLDKVSANVTPFADVIGKVRQGIADSYELATFVNAIIDRGLPALDPRGFDLVAQLGAYAANVVNSYGAAGAILRPTAYAVAPALSTATGAPGAGNTYNYNVTINAEVYSQQDWDLVTEQVLQRIQRGTQGR